MDDSRECKHHPLYIVLDVSESMWRVKTNGERPTRAAPSAESFMTLIPNTLMALSESPLMSDVVSVSVLAFSDQPEVLQPMQSLASPPVIADPARGMQSDYAAILHFLVGRFHHDAQVIAEDQRQRGFEVTVARPTVFMMTDGAPFVGTAYQQPREWMPFRDALVAASIEARIAAVGLPGACEPVLWRLATGEDHGDRNAFIAGPDTDPDSLADSIVAAVASESLVIHAPDGMCRIQRPIRR